jgi:hypothetical protein
MASKSALVAIASVLSVTIAYAQQPTPPAPQAPVSPPAAATSAQPPAQQANPFQLPLIPLHIQRPLEIQVDRLPVMPPLQPSPQSRPAPCTTHKMPMAFADPNFDSKMVIKGAAPKPPCT